MQAQISPERRQELFSKLSLKDKEGLLISKPGALRFLQWLVNNAQENGVVFFTHRVVCHECGMSNRDLCSFLKYFEKSMRVVAPMVAPARRASSIKLIFYDDCTINVVAPMVAPKKKKPTTIGGELGYHFRERFQQKTGTAYMLWGAKENTVMARVAKVLSVEDAKRVIDAYFDRPDQWAKEKGYTAGIFYMKINELTIAARISTVNNASSDESIHQRRMQKVHALQTPR